jgi:hypothetical protein
MKREIIEIIKGLSDDELKEFIDFYTHLEYVQQDKQKKRCKPR